jgi:predicted TIM-barrel fold metal-dependent hydrolase
MLTRRTMLLACAGAGALFALQSRQAHAAASSTVKTPVNFDVPRGACDCHVHVFDPARFPYFSGRVYTPPEATAEDLLALQKQLHFDRVVIVQPSVYGVDNACTLDAIKKLGPARARGVAVIDKRPSAKARSTIWQQLAYAAYGSILRLRANPTPTMLGVGCWRPLSS